MVKVLIVDDEIQLLRNLASYVGSFKDEFEVVTASSGKLAEQALLEHPDVKVMLTDVRLPDLGGIELVCRAAALRPHLKVLIMTAYPSPAIRQAAATVGALRYIEKPLDLKELREMLLAAASDDNGWSGAIGGLDIFDFTQLLVMSGKSTALRVTWRDQSGVLVFRGGRLTHASCGDLQGDDAFYFMTTWPGGRFEEKPLQSVRHLKPNVQSSTSHLVMEAARLRDERRRWQNDNNNTAPPPAGTAWPEHGNQPTKHRVRKEEQAMAIRELLTQFEDISGFQGAAVYSPSGEMLEHVARSGIEINAVGTLANNALLYAQKATDQMGVGRGNYLQIRAPKAIVLMRCLNEATDFASTAEGKAHFHTVVVLDPEGNIGMAGMLLDKVVVKIADELR